MSAPGSLSASGSLSTSDSSQSNTSTHASHNSNSGWYSQCQNTLDELRQHPFEQLKAYGLVGIVQKGLEAGLPLNPDYQHLKNAKAILEKTPDLLKAFQAAWLNPQIPVSTVLDRSELLDPSVLAARRNVAEAPMPAVSVAHSKQATELSWKHVFQGKSHSHALDTISAYCRESEGGEEIYARYVAVVQSSGTGKSRMIDQMATVVPLIIVNLRPARDKGFPPADVKFRTFFEHQTSVMDGPGACFQRSAAFLTALFSKTLELLKRLAPGSHSEAASMLHVAMSDGMTFDKHGICRINFATEVVALAADLVESIAPEADSSSSLEGLPRPHYHERPVTPPPGPIPMDTGSPVKKGSPQRPSVRYMHEDEIWTLEGQARALEEWLANLPANPIAPKDPLFIVCFDEAHQLADPIEGAAWTVFSELRRAIRKLNGIRIFFFFLSTTAKLHQFSPTPEDDWSNRLQSRNLRLFPPFSRLELDILAKPLWKQKRREIANRPSGQSVSDLEVAQSKEWMAHLGRPLFGSRYDHGNEEVKKMIIDFAQQKLVGRSLGQDQLPNDPNARFAVIATRIPLDFNPLNMRALYNEQVQVEKHLRVCMTLRDSATGPLTVAASEPLLAEAARGIMIKGGMNNPRELQIALKTSGMDKGDRGELIAMLLLIESYDMARMRYEKSWSPPKFSPTIPLLEFIRCLFPEACRDLVKNALPTRTACYEQDPTKLADAFSDANVYFNHFIRALDFGIITQRHLAGFMKRGAAILCAVNQPRIDICIPVSMRKGSLEPRDMGAIFVQVKNSKSKGQPRARTLLEWMDPHSEGTFNEPGAPTIIIRLLFELASHEAFVRPMPAPKLRPIPRKVKAGKSGVMDYMAYDIWCGRASGKTFRVIRNEADEAAYRDLLLLSCNLNPILQISEEMTDVEVEMAKVCRRMNPCVTRDLEHWEWEGEPEPPATMQPVAADLMDTD